MGAHCPAGQHQHVPGPLRAGEELPGGRAGTCPCSSHSKSSNTGKVKCSPPPPGGCVSTTARLLDGKAEILTGWPHLALAVTLKCQGQRQGRYTLCALAHQGAGHLPPPVPQGHPDKGPQKGSRDRLAGSLQQLPGGPLPHLFAGGAGKQPASSSPSGFKRPLSSAPWVSLHPFPHKYYQVLMVWWPRG